MTGNPALKDPLEVARLLIEIDDLAPALRARLSAAFARQALEEHLLERYGILDRRIPRRPLLAFARTHEPDFGARASTAWLHLTWATHQRTDEVDPDLHTIRAILKEIVSLLATPPAPTGPTAAVTDEH